LFGLVLGDVCAVCRRVDFLDGLADVVDDCAVEGLASWCLLSRRVLGVLEVGVSELGLRVQGKSKSA
jgi:hypothetical protein